MGIGVRPLRTERSDFFAEAADRGSAADSSRRGMLALMSLSTQYHYIYCMMMSSALFIPTVIGGALMMSGLIGVELTRLLMGHGRRALPGGMRAVSLLLLAFMLICNLLLLSVYPAALNVEKMWIVFTLVLLIIMRGTLLRRLVERVMRGSVGKRAFVLFACLLELVPAGVVAAVLFLNMSRTDLAWQMLAGFALGAALEGYGLWRERKDLAVGSPGLSQDPGLMGSASKGLHEIGAYKAFERFHRLILVALQITLVMVYTFIGLTLRELLTSLGLALSLTLLLREGTDWLLRKMENRRPAATQLLLAGLFLWIYGLVLFYRQLGQAPSLLNSSLALALSMAGATVSSTCLAEIERLMASVARYGLLNRLDGYAQVRRARTELSILGGQMLALALLTLLSAPWGRSWAVADVESLFRSFRPLMILPPMLLLLAAFVSVLHFPMNSRYFRKLRRFLTLNEEGRENPAMKEQLDNVVVKRHKNRYALKVLMILTRPLYYHKVLGKENLAGYEDGTMILVCNHGEVYGPVVANLYVPVSFRPWSASDMMDKEAIVEHMYQGTMKRQKWLPEKWKRPIIRRVFYPLFHWVYQSIESIPVYTGEPRKLVQTFRLTLQAMQAEDNILIFPESGEDHAYGERGYVAEGVGRMYTGFAMLAPLYYARTGKRAVFVPIYASRKLRTLFICQGVEYNPDAPANQEKLRIVEELLSRMREKYELELAETGGEEKGLNGRSL